MNRYIEKYKKMILDSVWEKCYDNIDAIIDKIYEDGFADGQNDELTRKELTTIEYLLIENRDDAKLQKLTDCSYLESIRLLNKIREIRNNK